MRISGRLLSEYPLPSVIWSWSDIFYGVLSYKRSFSDTAASQGAVFANVIRTYFTVSFQGSVSSFLTEWTRLRGHEAGELPRVNSCWHGLALSVSSRNVVDISLQDANRGLHRRGHHAEAAWRFHIPHVYQRNPPMIAVRWLPIASSPDKLHRNLPLPNSVHPVLHSFIRTFESYHVD